MNELYRRFDNVFFEKTRLSILTILYQERSASFNSLKLWLNVSDGSLYSHLEKLIAQGYVAKRKDVVGLSVETVYKLTKQGAEVFVDYIEFLKSVLDDVDEQQSQ